MNWVRHSGTIIRGQARKDVLANIVAVAVALLLQLATVPLLLHSLGAALYGRWLLIFALPSFLGLTDLGIAAAGSVAATDLWARDARPAAVRLFFEYRTLIRRIVYGLGAILSVGVLIATVLHRLPPSEATSLIVLAAWGALGVDSSVLEGGFRLSGQFPRGVFLLSAARVVETIALVVTADTVHALLPMAASLLIVRFGFVVIMRRRLIHAIGQPDLTQPRPTLSFLVRPSLASLLLPASALIASQGVLLVGAYAVSVSELPKLNAIRLFGGLLRQSIQAMCLGGLAELTRRAAGSSQRTPAGLQRRLMQVTSGLSIVAIMGAFAVGPEVIHIWTGLQCSRLATVAFVGAVAAEMSWFPAMTSAYASNAHLRPALFLVLTQITACIVAYVSGLRFGLDGVAVALLITHGVAAVIVRLRPALAGVRFDRT